MNERVALPVLFALLLLAVAPRAKAQTTIELGPRAGFEVNDLESFVLGGDLRVSTVELPFKVQGAFDYYFVDAGNVFNESTADPTVFRFTGNALYEVNFGENENFTPYFGPGLSVTAVSVDDEPGEEDDVDTDAGDTDIGLNVVGGARFDLADFGFGTVRPFVQAEFVPLGGEIQPFQVTGGILFQLGGV